MQFLSIIHPVMNDTMLITHIFEHLWRWVFKEQVESYILYEVNDGNHLCAEPALWGRRTYDKLIYSVSFSALTE